MNLVGGHGLPTQLCFVKKLVCQSERIGTLRGGGERWVRPLDPPMLISYGFFWIRILFTNPFKIFIQCKVTWSSHSCLCTQQQFCSLILETADLRKNFIFLTDGDWPHLYPHFHCSMILRIKLVKLNGKAVKQFPKVSKCCINCLSLCLCMCLCLSLCMCMCLCLCLQISFNSYTFYSQINISNKINPFLSLKSLQKVLKPSQKGKNVISTTWNNYDLCWPQVTWP